MSEAKYCFVTINMTTRLPQEKVLLSGNSSNLGNWEPTKAKVCKKIDDTHFTARCRFTLGQEVEFKFVFDPDWTTVEKGMWIEEIKNHNLIAEKGLVINIDVYNWAK